MAPNVAVPEDRDHIGASGAAPTFRGRVVKAAFDLFCERGFAATTMLEIATRAQASKRDLYAAFENKHAILADCIGERARGMRRLLDPSSPLPTNKASLEAMLIGLGTAVMRAVSSPEVLMVYRLAISESDRFPEIARILDRNGRHANQAALAEFLARAQAHGLVGPGDAAAMASRYFAALWGDVLVRLLLRVRDAPSAEEIASHARAATDAALGGSSA